MSGTNWWKSLTQLRNIKDETILNHQIAKQQLIYVLTTAIKNSILPDVLAHIILNFIITKELYKNANNKNLQFTLNTLSLTPINTKKYMSQGTKLWQANYKKCVGMEFKLKRDIIICGVELDFLFQGVQVYAVLNGYKKIKNKSDKSDQKQGKKYMNEFMYKLIPCDHRQRCLNKGEPLGRWKCQDPRFHTRKSTEMIFTEIDSLNQGGLKLLHKNMIYKLGFIISDGFYCNKYIDLKRIKNGNAKNNIDNGIKCISYRWLNKNKLLGGNCIYFNEGLIDKDGSSNALKWMPNMRFITF